jgi:type IV pilus assembly protein PilE
MTVEIMSPRNRTNGFTLIELLVAVAIIVILAAIALPSYRQYVIRSNREAAQGELLQLASLQEKIFLNSGGYSNNVATAYTGQAAGGLGKTGGTTADGKYTIAVTVPGAAPYQSYTLTATPVSGKGQQGDGNITIDSSGNRLWYQGGGTTGKAW